MCLSESVEQYAVDSETSDYLSEIEKIVIKDGDAVAPFKCPFCDLASAEMLVCVQHIHQVHSNWQIEYGIDSSLKMEVKKTVHTNPNWKEDLFKQFQEAKIDKCTKVTRDAYAANENISSKKTKRDVRNEIINTVIDHLIDIYGGVGCPKIKTMREIVVMLGHKYPRMFSPEGGPSDDNGYGFGGHSGLKRLPEQMIDRFRDRIGRKLKEHNHSDADEPPAKQGKRKEVYGVDNKKYYAVCKDQEAIDEIAKSDEIDDFTKREAIYSSRRNALAQQFRNGKKHIHKACKGFFLHKGHLANQFGFFSNGVDILETIKSNFRRQTDFLLKYLEHVDNTVEFKDKMSKINEDTEVEFHGSSTYRDIEIFVRYAFNNPLLNLFYLEDVWIKRGLGWNCSFPL